MTYRDETLMLRERLGELGAEQARLEGRLQGLDVALAETEERIQVARRALAALPAKERAKRLGAGVVGVLAGTIGGCLFFGGGCVVLAVAGEWLFGGVDLEVAGVVASSDREHLEGARCDLVVETSDEGEAEAEQGVDACHARVTCEGRTLYAGRGGCGEYFESESVEYWDHALDDGSPIVILSERDRRLVVRDATSTTIVQLDP